LNVINRYNSARYMSKGKFCVNRFRLVNLKSPFSVLVFYEGKVILKVVWGHTRISIYECNRIIISIIVDQQYTFLIRRRRLNRAIDIVKYRRKHYALENTSVYFDNIRKCVTKMNLIINKRNVWENFFSLKKDHHAKHLSNKYLQRARVL